jgi:CRISPR system Cascade subunit CasE
MSEPLYMLRAAPDRPAIAAWAATQGLLGRDGELGYALHATLTAAFGELAPRPFRLYERRPRRRGDPVADDPVLYAYSRQPAMGLLEHARAFADPALWAVLGLDHLAGKPMPTTYPADRRLGFEVRVRPVRRRERQNGTNERDVFLIACDRVDAATPVDRAEVYTAWLDEQFATGGARLVCVSSEAGSRPCCRLDAFRRARVARRDASRRLRWVEGPDAIMSGVLEVTEPEAFAASLARGIGRHRAFGFGMLLLRPA